MMMDTEHITAGPMTDECWVSRGALDQGSEHLKLDHMYDHGVQCVSVYVVSADRWSVSKETKVLLPSGSQQTRRLSLVFFLRFLHCVLYYRSSSSHTDL